MIPLQLVPARALGRWRELEFLFDYPGAFRNYREAIAKTKPPVIPFLANYSKNLFGIEENNVVYISEGIVNFERFTMLVAQIRDLQTYQQYTYPYVVDPYLYDYLVEGKNKYPPCLWPRPRAVLLIGCVVSAG